jgi:ABC-type protease/lipase transport system fused ATPase/permease subunit
MPSRVASTSFARLVVRITSLLDLHLDRSVHDAVIRPRKPEPQRGQAHQPVRDLDQIACS